MGEGEIKSQPVTNCWFLHCQLGEKAVDLKLYNAHKEGTGVDLETSNWKENVYNYQIL